MAASGPGSEARPYGDGKGRRSAQIPPQKIRRFDLQTRTSLEIFNFQGKKRWGWKTKKPVDHCDFPHLVGFRFLLSTQRVGQAGFGSRNLVGGFKYLVSFSHTTGMIGWDQDRLKTTRTPYVSHFISGLWTMTIYGCFRMVSPFLIQRTATLLEPMVTMMNGCQKGSIIWVRVQNWGISQLYNLWPRKIGEHGFFNHIICSFFEKHVCFLLFFNPSDPANLMFTWQWFWLQAHITKVPLWCLDVQVRRSRGGGFEGPRPGSESGEKGEVSFGVNTYEHIYIYVYGTWHPFLLLLLKIP